MADILSQSEIDALLSALTSGEVSAEDIRDSGRTSRIRSYDFRRAMRFSKDHIRIISRIHEHFARLMTTHLSGQLRTIVQFQLESVDQVPYDEFIHSIPALTVIELMEFYPLKGKVAVEMNPQIVFAVLDRFMGGVIHGPYRERELTEIEIALLSRVFGSMTTFFAEAWGNVADLNPQLLTIESNPQFMQLATPNETVLVVTLSARVGIATGLVNICLPHATIEPIVPMLRTRRVTNDAQARRDVEQDRLESHMRNLLVDVQVCLGGTELTFEELLDIQVGDVIPLQIPISTPVQVAVENVPTYRASIGRSKDKLAVKILDVWKGGDNDGGRRETFTSRN